MEAASPALIISVKVKSVVSSAAMSTSGWSSGTGSIGASAEEAEEAAAAVGGVGGRLADTGTAGLIGRPAVETGVQWEGSCEGPQQEVPWVRRASWHL